MTRTREVTTKRMAQKAHGRLVLAAAAVGKRTFTPQTATSGKSESAIGKPEKPQPKKKEGKKPSGRSKKKVS